MNVEGAFQHVLADMMGSGRSHHLADPILSVVIALLILRSSRHLMFTVMNVPLEGTPKHIDTCKLCHEIEDIRGVTLIHDFHIWTITSGSEAFTARLLVDPSYQGAAS